MRPFTLGWWLLASAALIGCQCAPPKDGAVRVEVTVVGLSQGCLEVSAADADDAATAVSTTLALDPASPGRAYTFGVQRKPEWSHEVRVDVSVREHDCGGAVLARGGDERVEVPSGSVVTKSYTLTVIDADGDGYAATSAGGTDCAPTNGAVNPGATELCGNGTDDDCDGNADCADSSCAGASCDDGNACTTGDVCGGAACAGTTVACTSPPGPCAQSTGTCGADGGCSYALLAAGSSCGTAMVCNNSGGCVAQDSEFDCADGITNDSDALVDCADPDCNTQPCDAGLCFTGETCSAGACSGAVPVTCAPPATGCLDAGVCNPTNGSCGYAAVPAGTGCSDNNACTQSDTCNGAGVCGGTQMTCTTPGTCEQLAGAGCDAGSCIYPAAVGLACDDAMACTAADACNASRQCAGVAYTCNAPPECAVAGAGTCLGDGGCNYLPDNAQTFANCDAGFCFGGACVGFNYAPSNHDPNVLPPGGNVVINCGLTFNTTDGGVSNNWCGGPVPNIYGITQTGSNEPAVVLSMRGLNITDAGNLRVIGSRPLIISVRGWSTTIDGIIDARAENVVAGAGGNRATCGAQTGGDGTEDVPNDHGAGAGGGGNRTRGADGGLPNPANAAAGAGGAAGPATLTPLVGGCPGGYGGHGRYDGGLAGAGGGAVQISAAGYVAISSTGRVSVSGGGSIGPIDTSRGGGGGGGSAGGILLEGLYVAVYTGGAVTANGGGGSEGSDDDDPGANGANGALATNVPAPGGSGLANAGGEGGAGAAGTTAPQPGIQNSVGGGGGGAAGRIFLRSINSGGCLFDGGAVVSPPAQGLGTCPP